LPAGLYSLDPLQSYLCNAFRQTGIHDDFERLAAELYIVAYNLDTLERVIFGTPPYRATCMSAGPSPPPAPTRFSFGPFK